MELFLTFIIGVVAIAIVFIPLYFIGHLIDKEEDFFWKLINGFIAMSLLSLVFVAVILAGKILTSVLSIKF